MSVSTTNWIATEQKAKQDVDSKFNKCPQCDKNFSKPKVMYRHCRQIHNFEPEKQRKPNVVCPLCAFKCLKRKEFVTHLKSVHNTQVSQHATVFQNMQEFHTWKQNEEKTHHCKFVARNKNSKNIQHWFCHRDGIPSYGMPDDQRKRRLKSQGFVKMGASCPASLQLKTVKDGFVATYCPLHLGHAPDDKKDFIALTEEEKNTLQITGLMSSWKRRNRGNPSEEPKVKKARKVIEPLSSDAPQNDDKEKMFLFDFTSPKRLFESLIDPYDFKVFFESVWEQKPMALHRNHRLSLEMTNQLTELYSKKSLLQLVKKHEMHFLRDLNALRYKNNKREDLNDEGRITAAKLTKLFDKDKATVQVHQPQRFQDGLWHIMEFLESFFGTLVGANVYITPGGSQGLSPHHDDVEVFILQLEGKKHWRLYKPVEELPRSYSIDLSETDIGEPTHDLILNPGDLLYFPRGTIHQADTPTGVSHSTHITFSTYQQHSWGDYMMCVFPQLLDEAMQTDIAFRRGLPVNFIKSTKLSQTDKVQSVMTLLLQKLANIKTPKFVPPDNMIEDFMKSRLPPHLLEGQNLMENLPKGSPPDLSCKIRLKYPDHMCFLVRRNPPEDPEEDEEEDEEDEQEETDSVDHNQSGASSARFLSRSLMSSSDEESLYVYSSIFNDHKTHMMDATDQKSGFAIRLPKEYLTCLSQLKSSNDQFIPVSSLELEGDSDKENLIRALWSSHLLEAIPGTKNKKLQNKSTKLD